MTLAARGRFPPTRFSSGRNASQPSSFRACLLSSRSSINTVKQARKVGHSSSVSERGARASRSWQTQTAAIDANIDGDDPPFLRLLTLPSRAISERHAAARGHRESCMIVGDHVWTHEVMQVRARSCGVMRNHEGITHRAVLLKGGLRGTTGKPALDSTTLTLA